MVQGLNANARSTTIADYEGGTLHLIGGGDTMNDTDGDTELQNKSDATLSTSGSDWSQSEDNTAGTTTLTNDVDFDFGSQDIGVVDEVVLESATTTGEFIVLDEPNNPDLTGENFTIQSGDLTYTLGGE